MRIKRFLYDWLIPFGFIRFGATLKNFIYNSYKKISGCNKKENQVSTLKPFCDIYKGKRCFILATGPSISKQDLKPLAGEYCIAVSMFHLHDSIKILNPIWHVLAPSHVPFKFDTLEFIIDSALKAYGDSNEINFLLGTTNYEYSYKKFLETNNSFFKNKFKGRIHLVDYSSSISLDENNYLDNKVWSLESSPFEIRTVVYSAIQLAYYLGFTEIILVGCDHDYLNDINRVENHHFYAEDKGFSDKVHLSAFTREKWFYEYYMRWKQYRLMNTFLMNKGVKIFNATEGGLLDVFPRVSLESLFIK